MDNIIDFDAFAERPDLYAMDREALLACLDTVREQIARLDAKEPKRMNSEEHETWGERHEELEDLADEIMDLLDEL